MDDIADQEVLRGSGVMLEEPVVSCKRGTPKEFRRVMLEKFGKAE